MTKFALLLPAIALLAACGGESAPAPAESTAAATAAPAPEPTNSLPAPDQETFAKVFAEACPKAEKVAVAVCKRAGFGSSDVTCNFGLGKDNFPRNEATLTPGDGAWALKDADKVCAAK